MGKNSNKRRSATAFPFKPLRTPEKAHVQVWDSGFEAVVEEWTGSGALFRSADLHVNRGVEASRRGDYKAAAADFAEAVRLCPTFGKTHQSVGYGMMWLSEFAAAELAFRAALQLSPKNPDLHFALALALLGQGKFEEGWQEYEWRSTQRTGGTAPWFLRQPRWDGVDLEGRTLLVYGEQGYGDFFQFARYLPLLKERGAGRVIFAGHHDLTRLASRVVGIDHSVSARVPDDLPPHDVAFPLLSLPLAFGTTLNDIPGGVPYLAPDPEEVEAWREQLDGLPGLKVGLVWAGSASNRTDQRRSMQLSDLAPLAKIEGVTLFSLQKGQPAEQAARHPEALHYVPVLDDWADTAALVAALDLVITVETGVAHLAGAMGRPVWTLLSYAADWRWLQERSDSPWYPTMRLLRQEKAGDWAGVVARVAGLLKEEIRSPTLSEKTRNRQLTES